MTEGEHTIIGKIPRERTAALQEVVARLSGLGLEAEVDPHRLAARAVARAPVVYRQLDRQRQPFGSPRRLPAAILVVNFAPEEAGS